MISVCTNESVVKNAEDAEKSKTVVQGIKAKSPLTGLVNVVSDIPIDYVHCVLEEPSGFWKGGYILVTMHLLSIMEIKIYCVKGHHMTLQGHPEALKDIESTGRQTNYELAPLLLTSTT